MSTLVGGTGIIGQDIFCSFGNGKYTTFEGTEIVAENCLGTKVRDLVIKGKTYQNLFGATLNQGHVISDSASPPNRRVNSDGFTLDSTTYTICVPSGYEVLVYKNYTSSSVYIVWANKIVWTNSAADNNIRIMVRKADNSEITVDEVIGKVILLEGDHTNTDLPTSIDGIESVAEREENLVNTATIYESMRESGGVGSSFNPSTSTTYDVYKIEIQPNTEYLFNLEGTIGYSQPPWVRILNKNNVVIRSQNLPSLGNYIWSLKAEDNFCYLVFNKLKTSTGEFKVYKKENPYPLKIKINEENNYINLPIPLRSLPNGVADTIEGNLLTRRVGKLVLNGTQSATLANVNQTETTRIRMPLENAEISLNKNNLICDWYIRTGAHGDYEYIIIQDSSVGICLFISVLNSKLETADLNGIEKYFKENPLPVYYELATPIIHDITVPQLSTAKGTNIITTSNNIKPKISMKVKVK